MTLLRESDQLLLSICGYFQLYIRACSVGDIWAVNSSEFSSWTLAETAQVQEVGMVAGVLTP